MSHGGLPVQKGGGAGKQVAMAVPMSKGGRAPEEEDEVARKCRSRLHLDSAVWETCTEYHCTPTKVFFKVFTVVETSSDCCNMAQGPIN